MIFCVFLQVVAAINYRPREDDELELHSGDVIHVLFREDQSWWFGRLHNGNEGYFPATSVTKYSPVGYGINNQSLIVDERFHVLENSLFYLMYLRMKLNRTLHRTNC